MKKGFTLVELLISIGLGTILLLSSFHILSNYTKQFGKSTKSAARLQICSGVLDLISKDLLSADKISETSSSSIIILVYPKSTLSYDYINGKIRRREGGNSSYLTDNQEVSSLGFGYNGKLVTLRVGDFETKSFCRN